MNSHNAKEIGAAIVSQVAAYAVSVWGQKNQTEIENVFAMILTQSIKLSVEKDASRDAFASIEGETINGQVVPTQLLDGIHNGRVAFFFVKDLNALRLFTGHGVNKLLKHYHADVERLTLDCEIYATAVDWARAIYAHFAERYGGMCKDEAYSVTYDCIPMGIDARIPYAIDAYITHEFAQGAGMDNAGVLH